MPKCSSSFTITDLNDGATGPQGPQGPQGEKGDTGATGPQGPQGNKGDTGAQGPQGEKGDKGDTGSTGPQGPQGNKGDTGATGNGISSITYYYAKTTTQNAPSSVTSTTIPALSATEKYLWQKEVIAYTDGTSKTTTALIGVYGDTGSKGDKGDKGDTGATGPQGPQGDKGDKGDTGSTGPQGPQGDKGDKGDTGATGPQGPQGEKGDTGSTGPQGPQGETGPQGPQGNKGDKGEKGDTGSTGPQGPQGPQGDPGPSGTPAYVWSFDSSQKTYVRDRRSSASNSITLTANVQGYSYTPSWTTTYGTLSSSTGSSVTLTIPFQNTYDSVTITMTYSSTLSFVLKLSVVDMTAYGHCYGLLSSAPTSSSSPIPIYVAGMPTDWYTNSSSGITYEYNGSSWVECGDAARLTYGLKLLIDNGTDLSTISDANTVSFFNAIIAQRIYAETIKAVSGFFDSIHVSGNSQFDGQISNDFIQTYPAISGRTIDLVGSINPGVGVQKANGVRRNETYTAVGKYASFLNEVLQNYGVYTANSGSISIYQSSATSSLTTYTASAGSPITITYTATEFTIRQSGSVILSMVRAPFTDPNWGTEPYAAYLWTSGGGTSYQVDAYVYKPDVTTFPVNIGYSPRYSITACSLVINGSGGGAEVNDILPKGNSNTIGTSSRPFNAMHASTFYGNLSGTSASLSTVTASGQITASSFNATSSRKAKENIRPSSIDALKLLQKIGIVDFNFKTDHRKTPRIGFIAEDTDSLLSTPKHNSMDMGNCIGLLLKAVQELYEEVQRLKEK